MVSLGDGCCGEGLDRLVPFTSGVEVEEPGVEAAV